MSAFKRAASRLLRLLLGSAGWRRLKIMLGKEPDTHVDRRVPLDRYGTEYGGWDVAAGRLDEGSVVYSFGVGGEVSFDLGLIEMFGLTVHAFDPTPQCIEWAEEQDLPEQFVMHGYGIAGHDGDVTFNPPENPQHVSHTILDRPATADRSIIVPVKRLATIMYELGHSDIDLMKMDVEGAEYDVIDDLATTDVRPRQLLVEFHHRFDGVGNTMTEEAVGKVKRMGYSLVHITDTGEEYSFLLD